MRYESPYPSLDRIDARIDAAQSEYAAEMRRLFPDGVEVVVTHYHGSYDAVVVGRDRRRIIVKNKATGKITKPYPSLRAGIHNDSTPCVQRKE